MFGFGGKLNLAVKNPCHESWNAMRGDRRARYCESCRKTVHDLSQLTRTEAAKLVREAEGSFCGRITRDVRGEVVYRRESSPAAKLVGLSLLGASALAAQVASPASGSCRLHVNAHDVSGGAIPGALVTINSRETRTDREGLAKYDLPPGSYAVQVDSPGFRRYLRRTST